ncbi:MAG: phage major capsid protein, partial [Arenimonas sp.]
MSEGSNVAGGYIVPQEFANDVIDLREMYGAARRVAKVVPMGEETRLVPRRRSGLTAYWVGEASAITASDKNWDQVQLVAKKLGCLALFSSELNEDAMVNLGDDLAGEIAYAFAYAEDSAYFNGDGTSTYGGITGCREKLKGVSGTIANIKGLKVGTGNAYSELVLADFHGVIAKLPLYARNGARWVVSSTFFDTVMHPLQTAAGGNTVVDIANGGQARFLGYPVEFAQVMPTAEANSQVCALLGNFMLGSTIGDRRQITIALSSEYKFAEDQLAIKGTERLDMVVHDVGDTSVAGPIVGLITAAA